MKKLKQIIPTFRLYLLSLQARLIGKSPLKAAEPSFLDVMNTKSPAPKIDVTEAKKITEDGVNIEVPGTWLSCESMRSLEQAVGIINHGAWSKIKLRLEGGKLEIRTPAIPDETYLSPICYCEDDSEYDKCHLGEPMPASGMELTVWREDSGWIIEGPWVESIIMFLDVIKNEIEMSDGKPWSVEARTPSEKAKFDAAKRAYTSHPGISSYSEATAHKPQQDQPASDGVTTPVVIDPVYHSFERLTLDKNVVRELRAGINKVQLQDFIMNEWDMKSVEPRGKKVGLNFYGPPGTGKTAAAMAIACHLCQPLRKVDYSQITSKWVGETTKNVKKIFEEAKRENAILLFDEADSLLARRTSGDDFNSQSSNETKNLLLQEIDAFDGIIIFTTNFFDNYDPAVIRRIAQHVEFKLPTAVMLSEIFRRHIPAKVPLSGVDFQALGEKSLGLSGGDVLNVCKNAVLEAASSEVRVLTGEMLLFQIESVREAKGLTRARIISMVG